MTAVLSPYINFPGNTREALSYYQSIFGGDLSFTTFAESGMPYEQMGLPADLIAHAELSAPGLVLRGSDAMDSNTVNLSYSTYSLAIVGDDVEWARAKFEALSADGSVEMPFEKQEWGDFFGSAIDKFGVRWMLDATPQEA